MTVCSSWSIFPFPLPSTLTIYSILPSELQPSPSLELHSRHGSLASLGIWYPDSRPAFHATLEALSPSQRTTIGVITNETTCIRADSGDGWDGECRECRADVEAAASGGNTAAERGDA